MTALEEKQVLRKVNSGEEAYNAILNGITSGELKPGLVISEHDLSEMYEPRFVKHSKGWRARALLSTRTEKDGFIT